jgi:hypothetical protein
MVMVEQHDVARSVALGMLAVEMDEVIEVRGRRRQGQSRLMDGEPETHLSTWF